MLENVTLKACSAKGISRFSHAAPPWKVAIVGELSVEDCLAEIVCHSWHLTAVSNLELDWMADHNARNNQSPQYEISELSENRPIPARDLADFHLRWPEFRPFASKLSARENTAEVERETIFWLMELADRIGIADIESDNPE